MTIYHRLIGAKLAGIISIVRCSTSTPSSLADFPRVRADAAIVLGARSRVNRFVPLLVAWVPPSPRSGERRARERPNNAEEGHPRRAGHERRREPGAHPRRRR